MYAALVICTELILRRVLADFAYIIWECLKPEEITNICHFLLHFIAYNHVLHIDKVVFLIGIFIACF